MRSAESLAHSSEKEPGSPDAHRQGKFRGVKGLCWAALGHKLCAQAGAGRASQLPACSGCDPDWPSSCANAAVYLGALACLKIDKGI